MILRGLRRRRVVLEGNEWRKLGSTRVAGTKKEREREKDE